VGSKQALKEFQLKFQTGRTRCRFRGGDPKLPSCRMVHVARPLLLLLALFLRADADTPPRFTRTPVDQTGVSGGVASFICQATGDPRPKIVWNKKGKKVSNQRFEVIEFDDGSGSVLRIQPLRTPRDEAIYECVASNNVGEISVSTRLTVLRGKYSSTRVLLVSLWKFSIPGVLL